MHIPSRYVLTPLSFDTGPGIRPRCLACSESPYYRLLCAYRVKDGIDHIRRELGKAAAALGKQRALPELPLISAAEIRKRGASIDRADGSHENLNLAELFDFWWGKKRNAVAHLFEKDNGKKHGRNRSALFPSIGGAYRDFSSSAAILLHYARSHLNQLKLFTVEHLESQPPIRIAGTYHLGRDPKYFGALLMEPENPQRRL